MQRRVLNDVLDEEHDVVRRERVSVGPPVPFSQLDRDCTLIRAPFPCTSDVGYDGVEIVAEPNQIDLAPAQDLARARVHRKAQSPQRAAVTATFVVRQHHQRLLG